MQAAAAREVAALITQTDEVTPTLPVTTVTAGPTTDTDDVPASL
jgi:hypothetical protein